MEKFKSSQSAVTLKAIEYESKVHSLEDCMNALKLNENIPVPEVLKLVRRLANKQFKSLIKKDKLIRYA
jgi:hypothetical protein